MKNDFVNSGTNSKKLNAELNSKFRQDSKTMSSNAPIESLANFGSKSGQWLREVGINTIGDLEIVGALTAYQLVKQNEESVSLNLLWALLGGLEGKDWRELSEKTKQLSLAELATLGEYSS